MNEETKIILKSLRMLLWENWRKWDKISRDNFGDKKCVETNEIVELVEDINGLLNPKETQESYKESIEESFAPKQEGVTNGM